MQGIHTKFAPTGPLLRFVAAVVIGTFIWAMNNSDRYSSDVAPLMLGVIGGAAALCLIAVTESYQVAAWQNGARRIDRVVYNVFLGLMIMVPVRLVDWTGTETLFFQVVGNLAGVITVLLISQLIPDKPPTVAERDLYREGDELDQRLVWFLRHWPLICIAIWLMAAIFPPESGWSETHQLLFLVVLPALFLRLRARSGLGIANPQWPHAIGLVVLTGALLVA